jgi:spore germination cell wall hydrolase CwlJ-like protein
MSSIVRVAGLALAGFAATFGASFAGPSLAGESDALPITTNYRDHGTALAVAPSELAVNPLDEAAPQGEFDAPVIQHAIAPVEWSDTPANDEENPLDEEEDAPAQRRSLSQLVADYASSDVPDAELECLAGAVYFESKGEPLSGQLAVAEVIINRANSGRFPSSLCGVVKQRGQFSFVRGGRMPAIPRSSSHWRTAVAIAHIATQELAEGGAPRALFFHARRVSPGWKLKRIAAVGNHIFYR